MVRPSSSFPIALSIHHASTNRNRRNARFDDVSFGTSHPRSGTLTQHLAHNHSDLATVAFVGHPISHIIYFRSIHGTSAVFLCLAIFLLMVGFTKWLYRPACINTASNRIPSRRRLRSGRPLENGYDGDTPGVVCSLERLGSSLPSPCNSSQP